MDRAGRLQELLVEGDFPSIRAFARSTGKEHSRVARILKILELPKPVLQLLRQNTSNPKIRKHFSERRLKAIQGKRQTSILKEIKRLIAVWPVPEEPLSHHTKVRF